MAKTAAGARLTSAQRREQLAIRAATLRDLNQLWRMVDPVSLATTIGPFAQAAEPVVRARRLESATSAAEYFEAFRTVEGVPGGMMPQLAEALASELVEGQLRGAGLSGIVNARRAGFSPGAAARNGLVKVHGQATEMVLGGGRQTVAAMAGADGRAVGWRRILSADPCPFCQEMARGVDGG